MFAPEVFTAPVQGTTARVTAGGFAPGQTIKIYSGSIVLTASAQTVNLETVTAGRAYLVTDAVFTTNDTATGQLLVQMTYAGAAILNAFINATKGLEMMGIETQPQATAGQVVAIVVAAGTVGKVVTYNVYGIEQ